MTEHCPEDGAFMGDAGCTHPNHQHSKLVQGIIADGKAKKLRTVSEADCDAALTEGFYVDGPNGKRIGFGRKLLEHINEHDDAPQRKAKLLYAVNTVMFPNKSENNHNRIEGRTAYFKSFKDFGIEAITSKEGDKIEYVFTYFRDNRLVKNRKGRAGYHSRGVSATGSRSDSQSSPPAAFPPPSSKATSTCPVPNADAVNDTISAPNAQGGFCQIVSIWRKRKCHPKR